MTTAPFTATFTNNPATRQVQGNLMLVLERDGDGLEDPHLDLLEIGNRCPAETVVGLDDPAG